MWLAPSTDASLTCPASQVSSFLIPAPLYRSTSHEEIQELF